jgi:hypothetical protein
MKRLVVLLALVASLTVFGRSASAQMVGYYPKGGPDISADEVSLIQLIANPERYDNKIVRVIGYLNLEFEGNAIYLHRDDFLVGISKNAIWINLPRDLKPAEVKAVNDHYVICTARFIAGRHGHMGMFSGELDDVTRLQVWPFFRNKNDQIPAPPKPSK